MPLAGKIFSCSNSNCNYKTNHKASLIFHTRTHTGEKPFVCPFESCSYAAATRGLLVTHSRIHTKEKPYKCPEQNCEYSAAQASSLKQHQLTHHPKEGEERPSFSCPLCEYSSKLKWHLTRHIKTHTLEKLFKCDEPNCNFEARSQQNMESHKVVHSDENPFACSVESCEFRCKWKRSLENHLTTHSDERQYKCELCPFRGKQRSTVMNHLRNVHSDFRPFTCKIPQCSFAAKTKGCLKIHLLTHNTEKKYSCPFPDCDFRTTTKLQIQSHSLYIHNKEKREKCGICEYRCKTRSHLTRHMRTHTKEKPFGCKENGCEYQAKHLISLKKHQQKLHPQIFNQRKKTFVS